MTFVVATLLWDANRHSLPFSQMYDESWVVKLFAGVQRNLGRKFRFVCFTDKPRDLPLDICQALMEPGEPSYSNCIEPYRLDEPMMLMGLDTVITGRIDNLADYCMSGDKIALPRDPYAPQRACNGVALVPAGNRKVFDDWRGENDMEWMRAQPHAFIDDLFPGHVVSFKGAVRDRGLGDARIVYFHGHAKPHQLPNIAWVAEHWRH